jgi:NAD(P)-dependent dehydrogenase (short-subunit alcohol dehydrogenase family)
VEAFPLDAWKRVIDVDLVGVFLCCRAVGKIMVENQRGSIINMASVAGFLGRGTGTSAYLTAKAGVINLTRHLAVQWAKFGVRVNAIAPSQIDTPLLDDIRDQPGAMEERATRIPMGRIGRPDELVGPVVFLASDASSFVTGHILAVDGGLLAF